VGRRRLLVFAPLDEEPGEFRFAQQVRSWRAASELAKVADEVRLVGVSAFDRGRRAAPIAVGLFEPRQRALKARDAREPLRRNANDLAEPSLQMAAGNTGV